MNIHFKNFFYSEGKAIDVTIDMENFANQTVRRFKALVNPKSKTVVYAREVDFGKYGNKFVKVLIKKSLRNLAEADAINSIIYMGKFDEKYDNVNFSDVIEHELIHLIDPKLTNQNLRDKSWGLDTLAQKGTFRNNPLSSNEEDVDSYYNNPWEVDGWMSQLSRALMKEYIRKYYSNKEFIKAAISKRKPLTPPEKVWFKNNRLWKKWLNTLYLTLEKWL